MSSASRFHASLGNRTAVLVILMLACLVTCHCDDDDGVINTSGPFVLTFRLAADYQDPHGGQPVNWALVQSSDGLRVVTGNGTLSTTGNPAFTLTTGAVLESGIDYELHYWIDSNIDGGALGVCDPEDIDHQGRTIFLAPASDINFVKIYNPDHVEYVCDTFNP